MIDLERHLIDDADLLLADLGRARGDAGLGFDLLRVAAQDERRPHRASGEDDQRDHADRDDLAVVDLVFGSGGGRAAVRGRADSCAGTSAIRRGRDPSPGSTACPRRRETANAIASSPTPRKAVKLVQWKREPLRVEGRHHQPVDVDVVDQRGSRRATAASWRGFRLASRDSSAPKGRKKWPKIRKTPSTAQPGLKRAM